MRLRDLEIIWAVSRSRSMREAGALLGVSQPAVSRALRHTHERLGLELFRREKGRLVPSPELQALMPDVEQVFDNLRNISNSARDMRESGKGTMAIATIPTLASQRLAESIAEFRRLNPRIVVRLIVLPTPLVLERLEQGGADIGLVHGPFAGTALDRVEVGSNRITVVVPIGHPLSQLQAVAPRDLRKYPLIVMSQETIPGGLISAAFERSNIPFAASVEVTTSTSTISLVRAHAGVGLVDEHALESAVMDGVEFRPFIPEVKFSIDGLLSPVGLSATNRARFLGLLRQKFAENRVGTAQELRLNPRHSSPPGRDV